MIYLAPPSTTLLHLPRMVEKVHQLNGRYLIFNDHYLNVERAYEKKQLSIQHAQRAVAYLKQLGEPAQLALQHFPVRNRIEHEAECSGQAFASSAQAMSVLDKNPIEMFGLPEELMPYPELQECFRRGFNRVKNACRNDSFD